MTRVRNFHAAQWDEPLILELGSPGERGYIPPAVESGIQDVVGPAEELVPAAMRRQAPPQLP
ncbi:MAG: hypothetical protein KC438_09260, partial [Thermomicrobiales bacterium]|nr:hypothetical protein [Thermomicrobiales bacterium]